jgi:hypothetical protein
VTPDQIELACAWADYRKAYGASTDPYILMLEHRAFKAGWEVRADIYTHESVLS